MNRRNFIQLLSAGIIGHELDIDRLLWVPGAKKIFVPESPKIYQSLYGIPYHEMNATTGTWMGITRSMTPWDWKKMCDKLCIRISSIEEVEGY